MAWNGDTVIDIDAHISARADRFFKDYIDPEYRALGVRDMLGDHAPRLCPRLRR